ncbi:hypothetical protein B0T24DRAFT_600114 [Lasiosphaeria ovina]|uniref:T6SS Phospholipase effector Tle1-like catalytic domain-containing protein n=1 Tax=Lasiosphaeria ovina TaxID=92902 RepID=A0AAE0JS28_9PEZI|nr:hypothetical protein B0T24DRAFT_600114 [Lasiosphaeria ovina]
MATVASASTAPPLPKPYVAPKTKLTGTYGIIIDEGTIFREIDFWRGLSDDRDPKTEHVRHVICCDGTGNNAPDHLDLWKVTNVAKLASAILPRTDFTPKRNQWLCGIKEDVPDKQGTPRPAIPAIEFPKLPVPTKHFVQIPVYVPGIGTDHPEDVTYKWGFLESVRQTADMAFASGFEAKLIDVLTYLAVYYKPNDEVPLFGFSRGAFTALTLAAHINDFGILKADMITEEVLTKLHSKYTKGFKEEDWKKHSRTQFDRVKEAVKIYIHVWKDMGHKADLDWNKAHPNGDENSQPTIPVPDKAVWGDFHHSDVVITMLGLYDTVAALGKPDVRGIYEGILQYRFVAYLDNRFSIKSAVHLVSEHEHREDFKCELLKGRFVNKGLDKTELKNKKNVAKNVADGGWVRVHQILCQGYHASVGGGTFRIGDLIPTVTHTCMVDFVLLAGIHLNENTYRQTLYPWFGAIPDKFIDDSKTLMFMPAGNRDRHEMFAFGNDAGSRSSTSGLSATASADAGPHPQPYDRLQNPKPSDRFRKHVVLHKSLADEEFFRKLTGQQTVFKSPAARDAFNLLIASTEVAPLGQLETALAVDRTELHVMRRPPTEQDDDAASIAESTNQIAETLQVSIVQKLSPSKRSPKPKVDLANPRMATTLSPKLKQEVDPANKLFIRTLRTSQFPLMNEAFQIAIPDKQPHVDYDHPFSMVQGIMSTVPVATVPGLPSHPKPEL